MTQQPDWPPRKSAGGLPNGFFQRGSTGQLFTVKEGQWLRVEVPGECTCGSSTNGKWADVHDIRCPAVAQIKTEQQMIDDAWKKHKAAGRT